MKTESAFALTPRPLLALPTFANGPTKARSEVERRRAAAERARGMLGRDPSRSFSDELIAERRVEARAEDREEEARQGRAGR